MRSTMRADPRSDGLVIGLDLDLTLVDLRSATEVALREANRQSIEKVDIDAIMNNIGAPFQQQLARWISLENLPAVLRVFAHTFATQGMSLVTAMPGARETIEAIRAGGDDLIVITGRRESVARDTLAVCGLPELAVVGHVFGADKAPAMTTHNVRAFVGDHRLDMVGAICAGVLPVGVATGSYSPEELRAAGAGHVLRSMTEFPAWFSDAGTRADLRSVRRDQGRRT